MVKNKRVTISKELYDVLCVTKKELQKKKRKTKKRVSFQDASKYLVLKLK